MRDIARLAGVNQSTVSRVLSSTADASISTTVRRKIIRISRRLDYFRNPSAVALRTGSTNTMLVVISDITDTWYSSIISGIEEVLVAAGYTMILLSLQYTPTRGRLDEAFHQYRLDGALLLGALPGLKDRDIRELARRRVPLMLVGRTLGEPAVASVTVDNGAGGRLAAAHLWGLGHRRIAAMRGPRGWPDLVNRLAGFRRELARLGLGPGSLDIFPCASREAEAAFAAVTSLLERKRPTALFCINDATAFGAIRAIRKAGLRVPRDVSVVGFDNAELAPFSDPPLTTVRQPGREMGRRGARELLAAIGEGRSPVSGRLDVDLVVRSSTCPPR